MSMGAIFDIDGTLVDSVDLHAQAWQEALRHFGFEVSFGRAREQIDKGADQLLPALILVILLISEGMRSPSIAASFSRRSTCREFKYCLVCGNNLSAFRQMGFASRWRHRRAGTNSTRTWALPALKT